MSVRGLGRRARSIDRSKRGFRGLVSVHAAAAAVALIVGAPAEGAARHGRSASGPVAFLTGPRSGPPLAIALAYLKAHEQELGLTASDLSGLAVTDQYTDSGTGTTHIYFQQRYKGIGVYTGITGVNIARDGSVINVGEPVRSGSRGRGEQLVARTGREAGCGGRREGRRAQPQAGT
jgi:fungalysin/thermolysin propeptide